MSLNSQTGHRGCIEMFLFGGLLSVVLFCTSCSATGTHHQLASEKQAPVQVRVCNARAKEYAPKCTISGTVVSLETREICSPVEGFLKQAMIHTGQAVRPGQLLMHISTAELERQHELLQKQLSRLNLELKRARHDKRELLLQAERQFLQIERLTDKLNYAAELCEHARTQYSHARELHSAGGISAEALEEYRLAFQEQHTAKDNLRRQLRAAEIGLDTDRVPEGSHGPAQQGSQKRKQEMEHKQAYRRAVAARADLRIKTTESRIQELEMRISHNKSLQSACTIRAPTSGFAAQLPAIEGSYIRRGDKLVTIVKTNPLYVQADLSAAHRQAFTTGTSVPVHVPLLEKTLRGRVHRFSPTIDPQSGCFEVFIRLESAPLRMVPGCRAEVRFATARPRHVLVVPAEALVAGYADSPIPSLQRENFRSSVFVLREGRSYLQRIQVLTADAEGVLVEEGIEVGEQVILSPPPEMRDGVRVKAVSPEKNEEVVNVP